MDIKKKIKTLPDSPGVYIMKDPKGNVIYVGKAASLRKRVGSYFREKRPLSPRLSALVNNISGIEYILAANEAEALLLENALIKSRQPKYNVALRDDKNYPLLKLTVNEKFPRLLIARVKKSDGAMYFGPYTEAKLLRRALSFLKRVFPMRTCKTMPKSLCLNFYLSQCLGPCAGKTDQKRYKEMTDHLAMFLEGKKPELVKRLEEEMRAAAKEKRYEEAARMRDQLRALTETLAAGRPGHDGPAQLGVLKELLDLKKEPLRIEAFDVSNISGHEAVGSMIMFVNGAPHKNGYRKFRIKEIKGIDDYAMMKEVVRRRYSKLIEEKREMPDLVIIDGGKGHLSAAKEELDKLGLNDVPVIAIAKEFEHIFTPHRQEPVKLAPNSPVLYLIQRIRDEAHRFAISYHTRLRSGLISASALDAIKGIGPKKKTALIKHFGSVENIKKAGMADLMQIKGINKQIAQAIKSKLN